MLNKGYMEGGTPLLNGFMAWDNLSDRCCTYHVTGSKIRTLSHDGEHDIVSSILIKRKLFFKKMLT